MKLAEWKRDVWAGMMVWSVAGASLATFAVGDAFAVNREVCIPDGTQTGYDCVKPK